jgi:hypothetical protein
MVSRRVLDHSIRPVVGTKPGCPSISSTVNIDKSEEFHTDGVERKGEVGPP